MKRLNVLSLVAGVVLSASLAGATPVSGRFADDSRGDVVADQLPSHEIGDIATFPAGAGVQYHTHRYSFVVGGIPNDTVANEWTVHLTNVTGQAWRDLFFVANHGATIGNADGRVQDVAGAPGVWTDAFRIDAIGVNANLLHESMAADGIFEIGEEWEFAVSNFGTGVNARPPDLISPGVFSGSSALGAIAGNASILAMPVPEPAAVGVISAVSMLALLRRTPKRSR